MAPVIDLTGQRFGRWLVVEYVGGRDKRWCCQCDCGTVREVVGRSLRRGQSRSCGCAPWSHSHPHNRGGRIVHGQGTRGERATAPDPLYALWRDLAKRARRYGHTVDERWRGRHGFEHFRDDLGPRPDGARLERIDPRDGYTPTNCRWTVK